MATTALADASAKEIYVKAAIGAITAIGLALMVGFYRLGNYALGRFYPEAPQWARTLAGIVSVIACFSVWSSIAR